MSAFGTLPRFGLGGGGELLLGRSDLVRPFLSVAGEDGATVTHDGGTLGFSAFDGKLGIAPVVWRPSASAAISIAAAATLTGVFADASGLGLQGGGSRWFFGARAAARARFRVLDGPFAVALDAEAGAPFSRPRFTATETDGSSTLLHRVSPVVGSVAAGLSWEIR